MAGEARSNSFSLSSATVMIGEPSALWDLNPATNSIGLVKNFTVSATPTFTNLTQGVQGQVVYSVLTNNEVKASMEVFEFTAKNLTYGLGLDGGTIVPPTSTYPTTVALTGTVAPGVTTVTITAASTPVANFPVGQWIQIQDPVNLDNVKFAQISATTTWATGVATLTFVAQGVQTGELFPIGSIVSPVNTAMLGSLTTNTYLAAKIVAPLPDGNRPMGILLPKIRIIKGFSMAFDTSKFGDLPFEFQTYASVPTDPFYSMFPNGSTGMLLLNG